MKYNLKTKTDEKNIRIVVEIAVILLLIYTERNWRDLTEKAKTHKGL
jgi:hypothetical protein